jgi:acetylglutamate synthase
MLARDFPRFFWRSRAANQINTWYVKQCDGFVRGSEWHIFWRGIGPETIEPAIRCALSLPSDFG